MFASGSKLGPYEIVSPIGAGGMGELYRARDARLERILAIKALADHRSSPYHRERFQREARAISSLSHPHICALYDVGQHEGYDFLVMEYLEGETLADRLQNGPLPTRQVLELGVQMAEALWTVPAVGDTPEIIWRQQAPAPVRSPPRITVSALLSNSGQW